MAESEFELERASPCKINLLLNVLGKRPDGFHDLETVMHPLALEDTLRFTRTRAGLELTCSRLDLPVDAANLVYRAAQSFLSAARIHDGIRIHLLKRIPLAAGLGGGSGNAATTLLALNELFGSVLAPPELQSLAAALGSDVPFFLQRLPALGTGRGEQITPLEKFAVLAGVVVLLIHPGFGVSTPWAYQALAQFPGAVQGRRGRADELISELRAGNLSAASRLFYNTLEQPVLRKYPVLQLYQEFLRENGALATLMSGSGSTTFALLPAGTGADDLLARFNEKFGGVCWTATVPLE